MNAKAVSRMLASALATTLTLLAATTLPAADVNWTGAAGANGNWSAPGNWSPAVPGTGDNLIFGPGLQTINTNDLTIASSGWILFNASSSDYGLYGNGLTITGVTNVLGNNAIFLPLTNSVAQYWDIASGSSLALSNTATLGATVTLTGEGGSTIAGVVSGAGGIVKNGGGTLTLVAANTHTGGLTINGGYYSAQTANGSTYGGVGNGSLVLNSASVANPATTVTMETDNSVFGQGSGIVLPRSVTLNTNTVLTTGSKSGHIPLLIMNGGTLSAASTRNDWGNWNLDLGVLTLTNGSYSKMEGASAGSGNVTLGQTGGTVFNIGAGDVVEVAMAISHTANSVDLGLVKTGDGVLRLTGVNTYTSPTTIQRGTVELVGGTIDGSSSITLGTNGVLNVQGTFFSIATNQVLAGSGRIIGTVNDNNAGALLSPGGTGVAGTLTIDGLTLNGNAALTFDLANVNTVGANTNDLLVVTNLTLSPLATNLVNINFTKGVPATGTYTLIKYQTGPGAGPVTTLAASASRYIYSFSSDGSSIQLTVTGTPASLVWKGDGVSNTWDVVTTPDWLKNGTADLFYQADSVSFTDAGSNSPSLNIVGTVLPSTITVSAAKDYSFSGSGKISGTGTLTKSGTGMLTINNANDFSGATTVGAGTVNLQAAAAISGPLTLNAGAVNVNAGSALGGQATVNGGTLAINAAGGSSATANTVNNGGNLVFNAGGSSGSAGGILNVNAGGTNTLLAGNAYGYSGSAWVRTLNINGGLVDDRISGDNGWGITINMTGGELRSNGGVSANNAGPLFSLGGGSAINTLANATPAIASGRINLRDGNPSDILPITVADGPADPDFLVTAAVSSSSSARAFSKNGPGNMVLAGNNNYNSPTIINAGTLQIGAGGTVGTIGTGNITNNAALVFNRSDALTVSAPIYGSGTVQNIGTGALMLNGTSTYGGATTVSAGTLQGTGTINSPVTVLSGANLSAGGVLGTGTLTLSNVTVNAGAGLVFDLSSTAATSDLIAVRGTLNLAAPTPVSFNFLGGTPLIGTPYTILTNWVTGRGNDLTYNNQTRYTVNLDNSQANRVQVTFTGNNGNLVWKGNVNNLWNLNTDANWLMGGAAASYYQSDAVVFDDNGASVPNVTLASDMTPANVTVNSSANYSFSGGAIATVGSLIKNGPGLLTLSNNNTFGVTTINAGTLQVGNGGTVGSLAGNIANFSSLVFDRSDLVACGGLISGPGTLTQAGAGTLLVTGNNVYSGGTTINAGSTLQVGNGMLVDSGLLGVGPVTNLGSLVYNRASQFAIAAPHTGSGALSFLGTGGNSQSGYQVSVTNTFTGPVTISQSRLYSTIGALGLGNPSSVTIQPGGQIFVTAVPYSSNVNLAVSINGIGWLEGTAPGAMGALRIQNGLNWAGPITLAGNARISTYNDANSNVISGTITGPYELELGANSGGFLSLSPSAANNFSALRLSPGTTWLDNANALPANIPLAMNGGTLKLNGNNLLITGLTSPGGGSIQNGSTNTPVTVTVNSPADSSYSGTFVDGGPQLLALVKNGGAQLTLSGLSTALGGVTVNGGVLALANGGGNGVIRGTVTMQPGTILLSLNKDSLGYNGGTAQVTNLNLNGASLIHAPNANISLWQNLVINMTGGYMAATNAGTSATLDLGNGTYINTFPSAVSSVIAGSGLNCRQANNIFNVADGAAADDLLVTAPIIQAGGAQGITKNGDGRMKVMNTFGLTGAVTVNGGSLVLAGAASTLTNSGTITLGTGAIFDISAVGGATLASSQLLQGSGTLVGNVSDGSGSLIKPGGPAVGTLTIQGGLTLNGAGSLAVKLSNVTTTGAGVNDLIQVNGDLSVNDFAPTLVNFTFLNGAPSTSGTYTFLKYTGNLTGSAAGLTNSAGVTVGAITIDTFAKEVKVAFTIPGQTLVWQGDSLYNSWDFNTASLNWVNGTVSTNFYQLDTVRFDDSKTTANTTVYLNAALTPASVTVDSTNSYGFTTTTGGKFTGVTSLTKNNTGTLTLGGSNDFTGTVTINGGVLKLETSTVTSPLGNGGNKVVVAPGAAFDFNGNTMAGNAGRGYEFTVGGAGPDGSGALVNWSTTAVREWANVSNLTLTADTVIGGNARFDMGSGQTNTTVNGGGFKLIKTGPGEADLRAQFVTNVAAIVITNGDFYQENFDRTNSWETSITNYAMTGGRLGVYGGRFFNMPIVLDAGSLYNRGGGTPNWISPIRVSSGSIFNNSGAQNIYGVVYGPGAVWVNGGTGTITVTNANIYTGGTVISNGPSTTLYNASSGGAALVVSHTNALGTGALTINGSAYASLTTNAFFFVTNVLHPVEFNLAGGAVFTNAITLPAAATMITNLAIQGRDANSVFTLSSKISGGFAALTNWFDNGAGNVGAIRLSNPANDFLGSVALRRGTLALAAEALGNSGNYLNIFTNATLRLDAPGLTVTHNLRVGPNSQNTVYVDMFGDNNGDGVQDTVNNATISGIVSGAGAVYPRGTNGTLTLSGVNTLSGGFELQQPVTLQVSAAANLGTAYIALKGGSTFRYTGTGSETMTRNIWDDNGTLGGGTVDIPSATAVLTWNPGGGNVNQWFTKTGAGALVFNSGTAVFSGGAITVNGGALTINTAVSGAGTVVQVNTGTLTLGGANTYGGPTLVNGGTLFLNGSLPAGNSVAVASGATLGGTGTINCPVNLQSGSFLQPGATANTIGTLTVNGPLALAGTTTMEIDGTAGTSDRLAGMSTVTYGGNLVVNNLTATPAAGTKFTLFSAADRLGSFSSVTLPPVTAPLYWTNTLAIDGSIQLLSAVSTTPVDVTWGVSGGNLNISWPTDHIGWRLVVQTNSITTGIVTNTAAWSTWPNSANVNSVSIPIDPANPTVFYKLVYP